LELFLCGHKSIKKKREFFSICLSFFRFIISLLESEDRLHLSIKNKQAYFVQLWVCTIFAAEKMKAKEYATVFYLFSLRRNRLPRLANTTQRRQCTRVSDARTCHIDAP
jgi:hypothetical protein